MIKFLYIINKQGLIRLSRYFEHGNLKDRNQMRMSVIKSVKERTERMETQCNFFEVKGVTIVYRKYVSLYLIAGVTADENELVVLELLQNFLETLDQYFQKVSEIDLVFNIERVHMILDEMIVGGYVAETSRVRALAPLQLLDAAKK